MFFHLGRLYGRIRRAIRSDRVPVGSFHSMIKYRTKDGQEDYVFSFEQQTNGTWRAYIVRQPPYHGRPEGSHETHRLSDGDRRYVCWLPEPRTLKDCKVIAAFWADHTQVYRRTGRFSMQ
jgi:hypothetical protein